MAISQVGFGLKPINKLGSNYNAAQVSEYRQVGAPNYQMVFQAPVKVQRTMGNQMVPVYSTGAQIDGSFVGAQYDDATGKPVFTDHYDRNDIPLNPSYQAGFNDSFTQFVTDDPYQLYLMKIDGDLTISSMNGNFRMNATATDTNLGISADGKRSIIKLDSSTITFSSDRPLQYITFGTSPDDIQTSKNVAYNVEDGILDAGSNVIVRLNQARFLQNSSRDGV
jgi:hypothetical protein